MKRFSEMRVHNSKKYSSNELFQRKRRKSRTFNSSSKHTAQNPARISAFNNFAQTTSLLGVQHFLRTKSVFWLIAYFLCVTMSIVQSWSVTVTFFEQKTYQTSKVASKTLMPFPSVTICSNLVLKDSFNFSLIPGFNVKEYNMLLEKCSDAKLMKEMSGIITKNKLAVRKYLRTLSDKQRFLLGSDHRTLVKKCKFGPTPCNFSDPNEMYIFSNTIYGNCFTFNPAFDDNSAKFADLETSLALSLYLRPKGYWLASHPFAKASIHIHTPGTAPLMELPEVHDVFGGNKAELYVKLQVERTAIRKWIMSKPTCVGDEDLQYQTRSRFYKHVSPYKYSLEACMKSCAQDANGAECGTVGRFIPLQSDEYERGKKLRMETDCRPKTLIDMEGCDCPIPCKYVEYHIIRDDKMMSHIPCADKASPSLSTEHDQSNEREKTDFQNEAAISVAFHSNVYDSVEEELIYSVSEYLGILGGNMSLWIGLCIISLLELVELVINIVVDAVSVYCHQRQRGTSKFIQQKPHQWLDQ